MCNLSNMHRLFARIIFSKALFIEQETADEVWLACLLFVSNFRGAASFSKIPYSMVYL